MTDEIKQEEIKTEEIVEKKLGPSLLELARMRQNEADGDIYDNAYDAVDDDREDNEYEA